MTCDFSLAEDQSFEMAFRKHFPWVDPKDYFHGHEVHLRIQSNRSIIPFHEKLQKSRQLTTLFKFAV
jgi:hypothetical protein